MTKHILILWCLILTAQIVCAQDLLNETDSLNEFYSKRNSITQNGMYVLGGWGSVNLVTGIVASLNTDGTQQYFYQMNAFWGGINVFISYTGLRILQRTANEPVFLGYAEMDQRKTERLFLINAGLDVLYIGAGFGLLDYSPDAGANEERVEGYGQSLILQGGFLLGFDLVMYFLHKRNKKKRLKPLLNGLQLNGMGFSYRF